MGELFHFQSRVPADIANQIAIDVKDSGVHHVLAKTDDGNEVHKVPVSEALKATSGNPVKRP